MKASTRSSHLYTVRSAFSLALALGALTVLNAGAQAATLDPITLSAPIVKHVGRDPFTEVPIDDVTVKARIAVDKETLRNDSGVVLLHDRVLEAAHEACKTADPYMPEDESCVRDALKSAQPQVAAAIASARSVSTMQ